MLVRHIWNNFLKGDKSSYPINIITSDRNFHEGNLGWKVNGFLKGNILAESWSTIKSLSSTEEQSKRGVFPTEKEKPVQKSRRWTGFGVLKQLKDC